MHGRSALVVVPSDSLMRAQVKRRRSFPLQRWHFGRCMRSSKSPCPAHLSAASEFSQMVSFLASLGGRHRCPCRSLSRAHTSVGSSLPFRIFVHGSLRLCCSLAVWQSVSCVAFCFSELILVGSRIPCASTVLRMPQLSMASMLLWANMGLRCISSYLLELRLAFRAAPSCSRLAGGRPRDWA